jgi:hypothetical protein
MQAGTSKFRFRKPMQHPGLAVCCAICLDDGGPDLEHSITDRVRAYESAFRDCPTVARWTHYEPLQVPAAKLIYFQQAFRTS